MPDCFGQSSTPLISQSARVIDAILRTLEREVLAAVGETDLPPPLEPVEYVLT